MRLFLTANIVTFFYLGGASIAQDGMANGCNQHDDIAIELSSGTFCARGLSEQQQSIALADPISSRRFQWEHRYLFDSAEWQGPPVVPNHPISEFWPQGANFVRISQGGLRSPPVSLPYASDFTEMRIEREGPTDLYWPDNLTFRDERHIRIRCRMINLPWQTAENTETCDIYLDLGDRRVTVSVLTGEFWDGSEGWPRFFTDYDSVAWQLAIDEVDRFLLIAINEAGVE
ncbi:hypothetical protein V8J82_22040 [Gymnodinialimonas sp. 2305UL16-5]|uniref:hypothetical protein n=1 Tax=Gymnodinialimonas mytili TaxID=3126503 RepID=UPI003098F926